MVNISKHLSLLGLKVKCKVTGFTGVVSTVSFDLYGCIQAVVNPGVDKDGKPGESHWFDVNRLDVLDSVPVMNRPEFDWSAEKVSAGEKGCADRPEYMKV